jgi:hypothetical protein
MLADPTTDASAIRNRLRELELDARRLITRAAYMEKLAERRRADLTARLRLETTAQMLRDEAAMALTEVSEICRRFTAV